MSTEAQPAGRGSDSTESGPPADEVPSAAAEGGSPVAVASWSQTVSMAICVLFGFAYFAWIAWTESWRFWLVAALVGSIGALGFVLHRVMAGLRQGR